MAAPDLHPTTRPLSRDPLAFWVGVVLAVLAVSYATTPSLRVPLTREDGITEWIAAATFLASGVIGLIALRRARPVPAWSWMLPTAGFIGFGEETAYGARILGFRLPQIGGEPIDSFHDLFDLIESLVTNVGIRRLHAAMVIAMLALAVLAVAHRRGVPWRVGRWIQEHPAAGFVLASIAASVIAVGFDLIGTTMTMRFTEEFLELTAAGILLVGATHIRPMDPDPGQAQGALMETVP